MTTSMEMNFKKLCGKEAGPNMENPSEYRKLLGALMFLVKTHPYIYYAVNTLIQFITKPLHVHWIAVKHVLRYLHGSITLGLRYFARYILVGCYITSVIPYYC